MPLCVDCDRWAPGTFKACPDCNGVLKLEPAWQRPSRDIQLERLDREARYWHRRGDLGEVEDRRRRYEELRRRLLPRLEEAEEWRARRMEAGAQASGLSVRAYQNALRREEREREVSATRTLNGLWRDVNAGRMSRDEYDRATSEAYAELSSARERADRSAARAEGLTDDAFRARSAGDRRARERLWGREHQWLSDPGGWAQIWPITVLALPAAAVAGLVLAIVFVATGRPLSAAVAGTVLGGVLGWMAAQVIFLATWAVLDRLAPRSWAIRRIGEPLLTVALAGVFVLPVALAVLLAVLLG
jgi:hypothetical protein